MASRRLASILGLALVGSAAAARGLGTGSLPIFDLPSLDGPTAGFLCFVAAAAGYARLTPRRR